MIRFVLLDALAFLIGAGLLAVSLVMMSHGDYSTVWNVSGFAGVLTALCAGTLGATVYSLRGEHPRQYD